MWHWQDYSMLVQWLASIHWEYHDIQYPRYMCICVLECIFYQYYILRPMQSGPVVVLFYIRSSHELNTEPIANETWQKQAGIYIYTNMLTPQASSQSLCRDWTCYLRKIEYPNVHEFPFQLPCVFTSFITHMSTDSFILCSLCTYYLDWAERLSRQSVSNYFWRNRKSLSGVRYSNFFTNIGRAVEGDYCSAEVAT